MSKPMVAASALLGIVALVIAGSMIFALPATVVGVLAAGAGLRQLRDDLDAAHLRFGVSVVVTLIILGLDLMAGNSGLLAAAVLALGAFLAAWRMTDRLRQDQRRAWGEEQRRRMERQYELQRRKDSLEAGSRDQTYGQEERGREPRQENIDATEG